MTTISDLIARIDAHETEGTEIDKLMETMGLDAKKVKAIRKAKKAEEDATRTLNALMGVDPATAEKVEKE